MVGVLRYITFRLESHTKNKVDRIVHQCLFVAAKLENQLVIAALDYSEFRGTGKAMGCHGVNLTMEFVAVVGQPGNEGKQNGCSIAPVFGISLPKVFYAVTLQAYHLRSQGVDSQRQNAVFNTNQHTLTLLGNRILVAQQTVGSLVLFDSGEAANRRVEPVVGVVITALADFAEQYGAGPLLN